MVDINNEVTKIAIYENVSEEGEHRNVMQIWFVPFVPWLQSSMSNHDEKWVFYDYHKYLYIYI